MPNVTDFYSGWVKVTYADPNVNPDVILVEDGMVEGERIRDWLSNPRWIKSLEPVIVEDYGTWQGRADYILDIENALHEAGYNQTDTGHWVKER